MAKKRVFLDECCGDDGLKSCFPGKAHVYVATDFGVRGKEDTAVIDKAIQRGCLIITVNKDFVDYYRNHSRRKARKTRTRREQLQTALKEIAWDDTREHDDLIYVSAEGKTRHERLCHPECAAEFPVDQTKWS
jgi:hypothetical protein